MQVALKYMKYGGLLGRYIQLNSSMQRIFLLGDKEKGLRLFRELIHTHGAVLAAFQREECQSRTL